MQLRKLSVINFKNLGEATLDLSPGVNCLVGMNGAGKTNVVDAIHYLSMCKSSLTMTDAQCVMHDRDFFMAEGDYESDGGRRESVLCTFRKGSGKTLRRNGKEYDKLSDHIGLVPLVIVSPADAFLISDPAEERRRYLNAFLSQLDRTYLATLIRYNQVLGERNRLLKQQGYGGSDQVMEILDMQLAEAGAGVHAFRDEIVREMAPVVAKYYAALSGDSEQVELSYRSELNENPMERLLALAAEKDRACQFTTSGVHRDDLRMRIGGHPLRKYGSQGQQKSFLVALKLAQYTIVSARSGEKPLLLLDDIFDKLDLERVARLLSLVSGDGFGQIFITDCNRSRLQDVLERGGYGYRLFNVVEGDVSAV